jgi:hypothetical protein
MLASISFAAAAIQQTNHSVMVNIKEQDSPPYALS